VRVLVFDRTDGFPRFRERLEEYEYITNQLKVEYVDLEKSPGRANEYKITTAGTVVFDYDGRTERVTSDGEQELTNGLIKVLQGKQHKVYFVQGHGEHSNDSSDRNGYSTIAAALGSDNFQTGSIVLAQEKQVPADASVLVAAGPKTDFFPAEVDMLKAYLAKGGKIFFMLDPPDRADSPALTNLAALLKDWAIEIGNNVVVDVSGMGQLLGTDVSVPVAAKYESHPITDRFNLLTAYPLARSVVGSSGGANGRTAQNLVMTSAKSWAETDIKRLTTSGEVARDLDKGDLAGPVSLAAAVSAPATDVPPAPAPPPADASKVPGAKPDEPPKPETRIVVFGDSDFVANRYLGIPGNKDLFLNAVNWLAQQENLISIRPRDPESRGITLTSERAQIIFWLSILIIPGLILALGVQTWWRRR